MGIVGQVFERARPFIEGIKTPGGNAGETCPYGVGHRVGRRLCSKGPARKRGIASYLYGMRRKKLCGARTRRGTPCQRKALANGRCPNHGGLSTGPRTPEGKARALAALQQGWQRWRERQLASQDNRTP